MSTYFGTLCIRADADSAIGTGHVMRCLALAQSWIDRSGNAVLASTSLPAALRRRYEDEGVTVLPEIPTETAFVVLDGYQFTPAYRELIKQNGHRLLIIDDLADSDLRAADLVLNQNAYSAPQQYPGIRALCGSRYALLRREFTHCPPKIATDEIARTVLITMGGSDPRNDTLAVLDQLTDFGDLHFIVLAGSANPHVETLRKHAVEILVNPPNVPEIMQRADVAITAGGTTCWELAALGVPMLVHVIADNQIEVAKYLTGNDAALTFEPSTLRDLIAKPETRKSLANHARTLVDGRGAARVAELLAAYPLTLRRAVGEDARTLLEWANDPVTRQNSFQTEPIAWETHVAWFERKLTQDHCAFFIAEDGDQAVGTIRFELGDADTAEVSFSLAPAARGRGLAAKMLRLASFTALDEGFCQSVTGWVKSTNLASITAFERAGFEIRRRAMQHDTESVEFMATRSSLRVSRA